MPWSNVSNVKFEPLIPPPENMVRLPYHPENATPIPNPFGKGTESSDLQLKQWWTDNTSLTDATTPLLNYNNIHEERQLHKVDHQRIDSLKTCRYI